jgi:hypothetical protein
MQIIALSTGPEPIDFRLVLSSDHKSGATGLAGSLSVRLSKNGGPFAAPDAATVVAELGDGWYRLSASAADQSTLGPLALHASATGADPFDTLNWVVAAVGDPPLPKGSGSYPLVFLLVLSSDGFTGATGKTPTVTISKDGGAFASPAGTVAEIGHGLYKVGPAAADSDTAGPLALKATASGCVNAAQLFDVADTTPAGESTPAAWPDLLYCTDEDVCIRAGSDFSDLVPADQLLAVGNDGSFSGSDRWTLTSAGIGDFAAQGVTGGMVALVNLPKLGQTALTQRLAIDPVPASGLPLRRLGQTSGVGQPPGPVGGQTSVTFTVATMYPQIESATYELNKRYGVSEAINGRKFADENDPRELREACVLTVLWKLCLSASRAAQDVSPGGTGDSWSAKANKYKAELDEVLDRAVLHWRSSASAGGIGVAMPPSSRFGTRLSR